MKTLLIISALTIFSIVTNGQTVKQWSYVNDEYFDSLILKPLNEATVSKKIYNDYDFINIIKPVFGMEALYPIRPVEEWDYFLFHICSVEAILTYYIKDAKLFQNSKYLNSLKIIDSLLSSLEYKVGQDVYGLDINTYKVSNLYNKHTFIDNLPRARIGIGDRMAIRNRNSEFDLIHQEANKIYK